MAKKNTDNPLNQLEAIFENFVPNFTLKGSNKTADEALQELKGLLNPINPCLINIYPKFDSDQERQEDIFSEQGRKGGYGKTMLLLKLRNALYHLYFQKDKSTWDNEDKKAAKDTLPLIELAEQYSTKEDILERVVNNLQQLDSHVAVCFQRFNDEIIAPKKQLEKTDPSYLAEQLFDEGGEALVKYLKTQSDTPPQYFLFFDAFDAQYLGNEFSPLRTWLLQTLFPYLILKMKVSVIVAGREEVSFDKRYSEQGDFKIEKHQFEVESFNIEQMIKYMLGYPKRVKRTDDSSEIADKWEALINSKISNNNDVRNYLWVCTNGKPIFIDYFCDLMLRICIEKQSTSFEELLQNIKTQKIQKNTDNSNGKETDEQIAFKTYLINRLHIYESKDDDYRAQIAEAISLLSIARHGLTSEQFYELKTSGKYSTVTKQGHIDDIKDFFNDVFTNDEDKTNLSYVKSRESKSKSGETEPIRLLHDEVVDLFLKYYYEVYDTDFKIRNKHLAQLKTMYEVDLNKEAPQKDTSTEYAKILLEYLQYALMYEGRKEEMETINRLLFEFSYFLDRHPDLCSRLLEKGYKYYALKKKNRDIQNTDKTLSFYNDFPLLFKLRMREAEYCLTERKKNEWKARIIRVFAELDEQIVNPNNLNQLKLTETDRCGLEARSLAFKGEMKFWEDEWDAGRKDIEKALQLFYQTGDSHGLAWVEHLLGFEAIRSGELKRALKHHKRAISSSLHHFPELQLDILQRVKNKSDVFGQMYRLRFLLKTINRANGNWAINLRYDGKILEAIKIRESNLEIADITGIREVARNKSNIALLYAIRGIESQWRLPLKDEVVFNAKIDDPILPRRITNAYVTMQLKKIGTESRIYAYTYPDIAESDNIVIDKILKDIRVNLPRKQSLLSVELPRKEVFKVTSPITGDIMENWLYSKSREVADLYYQYGKAVLASGYCLELEKGNFFEEARRAFENAQDIARKSTFKYLEMECSEMLYRIAYLSKQPHAELSTRRNDFIGHKVDVNKKKADYGIYNDLLAKFYLTEGDIALNTFSESLIPAIAHISTTLDNYAQALRHSHRHNQERYLLILNAFSDRIDIMFKKANEQFNGIQELSVYIKQSFSKQIIYKKDETFGLFLDALLNASYINTSEDVFNNALYTKIKITIRKLVERGKFVKAALVNQRLIDYFKTSKNKHNIVYVMGCRTSL